MDVHGIIVKKKTRMFSCNVYRDLHSCIGEGSNAGEKMGMRKMGINLAASHSADWLIEHKGS